MSKTYCIQVSGRVQGVGFRPFVYNLALQHQLTGTVSNNKRGVLIYINASQSQAQDFLEAIITAAPKVSKITQFSISESSIQNFKAFTIVPSETKGQINIPLTPDFSVCNSCKTDIDNPKNKRFNYAFTTCVTCGPRYAITINFPFERANTSINTFEMCSTCEEEYTDPTYKRFHSQTNSCSDCGIKLTITNKQGNLIDIHQHTILEKVANLLHQGNIVALKNTNGYILCCDASNPEIIKTLRRRKQRPNKPFAVVFPSLEAVQKAFKVSNYEANALSSEIAPIVILNNKASTGIATQIIAPGLNQTGVMLPHTALLYVLMKHFGKPMVATSGNSNGLPIISIEKEAQEKLSGLADYFLHHNLEINFPQDDSVVKYINKQRIIMRRSRGFAPSNLSQKFELDNVLATGADMKSAFAIAKKEQTYISQYFGNLASYDVLQRYTSTLNKFKEMLSLQAKAVLLDKHLYYYSAQLGREFAENHGIPVKTIQHHKAHFASVLGEHQLFDSSNRILGVIWDGTGLGDDQQIWGGEFFEYHNGRIERLSHFEYFDWIASDKMAKEPRLSLFSLLDKDQKSLIASKFSKPEWQVYSKMLQKNKLKTSSVGRLFDAVASALDLADYNTYEAEASMQLEHFASQYSGKEPIDILQGLNYNKIPSAYIVNEIFKKYQKGVSKSFLAYSFIYTLVRCIEKIALENKIETVACSGGVFQNSVLVRLLLASPLDIRLHNDISPNDENIAFGQLQYFQHIKESKNVFSNTRKNKGHYITT